MLHVSTDQAKFSRCFGKNMPFERYHNVVLNYIEKQPLHFLFYWINFYFPTMLRQGQWMQVRPQHKDGLPSAFGKIVRWKQIFFYAIQLLWWFFWKWHCIQVYKCNKRHYLNVDSKR